MPDDLAAFIDSLLNRLKRGDIPAEHQAEAERCLWEVDYFRTADKSKHRPEMWRSSREWLTNRLRALQRVL